MHSRHRRPGDSATRPRQRGSTPGRAAGSGNGSRVSTPEKLTGFRISLRAAHAAILQTGDCMDTDVLIVGAGPTGLMLANQLARRGVRAMIIDRHSGPAQQSRAMAVQARTLEIYSKMGLVDEALALGREGTRRQHVGERQMDGARSAGGHRQELEPVSVCPRTGPGRQRADHGRETARPTVSTCSGIPSWWPSSSSTSMSTSRSSSPTVRRANSRQRGWQDATAGRAPCAT